MTRTSHCGFPVTNSLSLIVNLVLTCQLEKATGDKHRPDTPHGTYAELTFLPTGQRYRLENIWQSTDVDVIE